MTQEIDRQIAEKVMGWYYWDFELDYEGNYPMYTDRNGDRVIVYPCEYTSEWFTPSADIKDAWQVVEKIRGSYECKSHNGIIVMSDPDGWYVEFPEPSWQENTAPTAPLAICRAALLATLEE